MSGKMISAPIIALSDAVESHPRPLDFDNLRLWSDELIHKELIKRSFVHKELGSYIIYALEYENARRLLVALQSEYRTVLEEVNARMRSWQGVVAARDRRIAELEVECAIRDERIADLENENRELTRMVSLEFQQSIDASKKDTTP